MDKRHNVQKIDFDGRLMTLSVDDQSYRLDVSLVSKRLATASDAARTLYHVSPSGYGIHWPEVDEDLTVDGLVRMAMSQRLAA